MQNIDSPMYMDRSIHVKLINLNYVQDITYEIDILLYQTLDLIQCVAIMALQLHIILSRMFGHT